MAVAYGVRRALAVVAMVAFSASSAAAQDADPQQIAIACAERVEAIATNAAEAINGAALAGVERIERLEENDAPARAIASAGREARDRVMTRGVEANRRITRTVARCTGVLQRLEAPPTLIQGVLFAGEQARGAVQSAVQAAREAIAAALQAALGDEADGG